MTLDESIAATVEQAVARAVEPLRRELAALRQDRTPPGPLTFAEAARRLKCSPKTVGRRVKDGTYQSVQVGRMTRVVLPDVTSGQRTG
jgi:excisionase family DNA binding protein